MTRTRIGSLVALAVIGGVLAWCLDVALQTSGRPIMVPGVAMAVPLLAVAAVLIALGWPIRRYTRWLRDEHRRSRETSREPRADASAADEPGERPAPSEADAAHAPERVPERPNPFLALRVLTLAKGTAFAGAVIVGAALAVLGFVLTRSFINIDSVVHASVAGGASLVAVVVALVVESWCALPPDGGGAASGLSASRERAPSPTG